VSAPAATDSVFCALCRRPHIFFRKPGLQFRDCECGGVVSLYVKIELSRWRLLEVD
jgi:hypothetical protein